MFEKDCTFCRSKRFLSTLKEEIHMIETCEDRMFGQLEDQAETGDIEAFVFRNGEVVPADQAENTTGSVIHTAPEKNYGQLEEQANGAADVQEFVFRNGNIEPAERAENTNGPVIHTAPEKNYSC